MKKSMKEVLKSSQQGSGHRFLGYLLFCILFTAVLLFCLWFKSLWHEPLGVDGLILSVVLSCIIFKAIPVIDRLIKK